MQGSVATCLRCGWKYNNSFAANFLLGPTVKKINISQHFPKLCLRIGATLFLTHGVDQMDMWVYTERKEEKCGVQRIAEVLGVNSGRLRWFGHVGHKDDADWLKHCMTMEVDGSEEYMVGIGNVKEDMKSLGLF